ncbi:MAG TPA: hypothetical protein VFB92_01730, partial [Vicinamibacterales bacterium]|nr:hypothetical protein [Vicinamibacterales bacterium]
MIGLILCLAASAAWGQVPPPRGGSQPAETQRPTTEPPLVAPTLVRPMAAYPLELLGLLAPGQQQGPVTLTPSLGISEEYNDNVFADNRNRQWDFITTFSPTITLAIQQPSYQLNAGYSF